MAFWFLSFANKERHLGAVVTKAPSFDAALLRTHDLGINPGGDAVGWAFGGKTANPQDLALPRDVLISWGELKKLGYKKMKDQTPESRDCLTRTAAREVAH